MTVKFYCGVPEECTHEQAQPLFGDLLDRIGIKMVFMHSESWLSPILERTSREIDELERAHPDRNNFPLQPNCFYSYMPLEETPNASYPIIEILKTRSKVSGRKQKQNIVYLNCTLPQERDYKDLPTEVYKDIIFMEETTRKELGWYNRRANLIWMSDIFHFLDNTKCTLPIVVESITEYLRYGRLTETLTIGADPEFEILDENNNFIPASSLFGDNGADPKTEIGYDGVASTGEFRPKPDKSPLGLTRNIKRLIRRLNGLRNMGGNKVWVGGGINVTTGGHIHFGMRGVPPELKNLIYDMVAEPVLDFQSEKRRTGETNRWQRDASDTLRDQPHGFEWRVLPSFIVNEEVTAAILSTTYAIIKSWKFYEYRGPTANQQTTQDYYKIPLYSAYKHQIDTFVKYFVEKREKVSLQKKDIFSEWKINRINRESTVDIISQADWLGNYFTPVNVKLKKPVKMEIRFNGDAIATFGIKTSYLETLIQFAHNHYLPEVQINEKLPKGQTRPVISLPAAWYYMTGRTVFCESFKDVLKNLILALGGQR